MPPPRSAVVAGLTRELGRGAKNCQSPFQARCLPAHPSAAHPPCTTFSSSSLSTARRARPGHEAPPGHRARFATRSPGLGPRHRAANRPVGCHRPAPRSGRASHPSLCLTIIGSCTTRAGRAGGAGRGTRYRNEQSSCAKGRGTSLREDPRPRVPLRPRKRGLAPPVATASRWL